MIMAVMLVQPLIMLISEIAVIIIVKKEKKRS